MKEAMRRNRYIVYRRKMRIINQINREMEFLQLIQEFVTNENYQNLRKYHHHRHSIYHHNINVAWVSYKIAKTFRLRISETVRGAMLHDFFFYDWRTYKTGGEAHAFYHPKVSLENAEKYFGKMNKMERNIILRHMWPLSSVPPASPEAYTVCLADKYVAAKEFFYEFSHYCMNRYRSAKKLIFAMLKF